MADSGYWSQSEEIMHVSKSVISKHAAYTDLNGTGQGYMPKMCLQVCMTLRSHICNHSL